MAPRRTTLVRFVITVGFPVLAPVAFAQTGTPAGETPALEAVVVTATRVEQRAADVPASIDAVGRGVLREQQPGVNLSEGLGRVPGLVIQNRQNYAQDLQVSSRGFGARAAFGVRGVRLMQDGIPLTMPDGQGQTALFDLDNARRVEVLRGPLAALYGNSSGGVVQLFTDEGGTPPAARASAWRGSYGSWKAGAGFGGTFGPWRLNADASRFMTDGYREHSAARRDSANARLKYALDDDSSLTLIANALDQPETQDPLGLDRTQLETDRRQAGTRAIQFDTRKSIVHNQGGLVYERKLSSQDSLRMRAYGGDRQVTQYQAFRESPIIPAPPSSTASGGVVDLDRQFGGAGAQWNHTASAAGSPLRLTFGVDYDVMRERRKGFVNNNGVAGALKRDELDSAASFDQYAIADWSFAPRWKAIAGVRHSTVNFRVKDDYIDLSSTPQNPDDSGTQRYSRTSPAAGVSYEINEGLHAYVAAGRGFETPTLTELAYRPDGTAGLNTELRAATSANYEVGLKSMVGDRGRANFAVFRVDTRDDIVSGPNPGGRATFVNAARTKREGVEVSAESKLGGGFTAVLAWTWLRAEFVDFINSSGTDLSGKAIPGVARSVLYAEIAWRHAPLGFSTAVEGRRSDRVYVNDANDDAAGSYAVFNWRAGFEQRLAGWKFAEFVRVDNFTSREYVGSVIVNAGASRFFEPAPTRTWLAGASASYAF